MFEFLMILLTLWCLWQLLRLPFKIMNKLCQKKELPMTHTVLDWPKYEIGKFEKMLS